MTAVVEALEAAALLNGARAALTRRRRALVRGRSPQDDWRLGVFRGLPRGLARGWRVFR